MVHATFPSKSPYVGGAAFRHPWQVKRFYRMRSYLDQSQVGVASVQVSSKTLEGELNKHPGIFPPVDELDTILRPDEFPDIELHVHFSPAPDEERGADFPSLEDEFVRLGEVAGHLVQGIQINQTWPDRRIVEDWQRDFPNHRIILSATSGAVKSVGFNPQKLYERFEEYDGVMTDLLFDLSGGRGKIVDANQAAEFLLVFRENWPGLRLGVAGGLGPLTMMPVAELIRKGFWPLSWDAQGRLCRDGQLDMQLLEHFVRLSGDLRLLMDKG